MKNIIKNLAATNAVSWGSIAEKIDENFKELEDSIPEADNKIVDLAIFIGQSNMAGRGIVTDEHPEPAPIVPEGHGYEFKAISEPTRLYRIVEPFGVDENNDESGVSETKKTGSMVAAFANSYYEYTNVPIVGVSCSKGGTSLDFWKVGGAPLNDAIARHNRAKEWLAQNGYTVRKDFMVWCQGESDAANGTSDENYISGLKSIIETMMGEGIEKCFIVRIGRYAGTEKDYDGMIALQTDFCKGYENAVLVSTDFAAMTDLLKDEQHYVQKGYNITGSHAGIHTAYFIENGVPPFMYDPFYKNLYVPYPVESENVEVDAALSATSENPVQNKVISGKITELINRISQNERRIAALESGTDIEQQYLLNLDFTEKSLEDYVADGIVSKNGSISSIHSDEGDLFSIVDTANLVLTESLTFPTNFEIHLRMKTSAFDNSVDDTGLGGISLFNKNGARPMINLRAPNTGTGSPHSSGFALQSRLVSSGGDDYTVSDVTIPINDGIMHDVIIHYEGDSVYMEVDGVRSSVVDSTRNSNTVTHIFGYRNNYNFNNVLLSYFKVYEV